MLASNKLKLCNDNNNINYIYQNFKVIDLISLLILKKSKS